MPLEDSLPFTGTQFLDNLGAFNTALWPVVIVLWLAALALTIQIVRGRARAKVVWTFAAILWAWSGIAYHAVYFTRINPAAWIFAALFVAQAIGFLWSGVSLRLLPFAWGRSPRYWLAAVFLAYSLLYPALVVIAGHTLPRAPAFGVPCPTTIFTAGLLLAAMPVSRWLLVVPIVWSLVAGSAAFLFGVTPDLVLFLVAVTLAGCALPAELARTLRDWGAARADVARAMRGDGAVEHPNYSMTLGIDIRARPDHVWPWLVQMGYRRGGLYSYDWLDRLFGYLDRPSADRILPEFQTLKPGDVIPIGRATAFPVRTVEPPLALVLAGEETGFAWSWELGLVPIGPDRTRLVSRNRGRMPATLGWTLFRCVLEPAAFIMTRRMLIGLRQRAEALAVSERARAA
ncbi:MAG: DUF6064 family protein [Acidobacteriia bacterium]|nr:DUF6064 family protein [Terriglobia bacterium]